MLKWGPWFVAFAALLWAGDAPFRKFLTQDLTSTTIVFMEHIVIAPFALALLIGRWKEILKFSWKEWLSVVFIALGGSALATILFTQSFHYVNPSVSILLQKVQPFIAIALAALLLKEKMTKRFWLWALVGIFGAYLITFPELKVSGLQFAGGTLGILAALGAAFFWAGSTVLGRLVLKKASFQLMTGLRFLGALFFLFLIALYYGRLDEVGQAGATDWWFVAIIALIAGLISLFIYYRGLKHTSASIATIAELAFPFSAVIINWIFLDAPLSFGQIVGGVVLRAALVGLSRVNQASASWRIGSA